MNKQKAPYGTWPAQINSELLTGNAVRLGQPQLDNNHCYWLEQRPHEQGRCVVVCRPIEDGTLGEAVDISPALVSVHSKAHEYGGNSYIVDNNVLYFVNAKDQRVYKTPISTETNKPEPIVLSPEGNYRYADFFMDSKREQLICVCEIFKEDNHPESAIVSIKLDGSSTIGFNVLVFGNDFYSNPSVSPDNDKLAWLTWQHPHMPWDSSECWIADFNSTGMLHKHRKVAGGIITTETGEKGESIFQPKWSPTGDLLFVSDRNNWWNLYSYNTYNKYTETLIEMEAEFATPQWVFGMSTYGFLNSYTLLCTYTQHGIWHLATMDLMSHKFTTLKTEYCDIEGIACDDNCDAALLIGASAHTPPELIYWHPNTSYTVTKSNPVIVDTDDIATPTPVCFTNTENQEVHAFFYHPQNSHYENDSKKKPPVIVMCHGGPTGATSAAFNIKIQYWTNRGFAVLDVNYSGSTGYGRDYRRRLYGRWGQLDVDDICCGVDYLIQQGWIDSEKTIIRGSSAGGYTVLAALTFKETFKAGASLYGIGDLSALAEDTHKFESRYCDQLVGPYPEEKALYQERSPIYAIDQLNCPVIFLQGLKDKVVPPNQAEAMVEALHNKGVAVAYVTFEDEGHGFRQADNIRYSIDVEYAFYLSVFGLNIPEHLPEIPFFFSSKEDQ